MLERILWAYCKNYLCACDMIFCGLWGHFIFVVYMANLVPLVVHCGLCGQFDTPHGIWRSLWPGDICDHWWFPYVVALNIFITTCILDLVWLTIFFLILVIIIKLSFPLSHRLATYWATCTSPLTSQSIKFSGWWQWVVENVKLEILWEMQDAGIMKKGSFGDLISNYLET